MASQLTSTEFRVYWQPGCSSCMKTKEVLTRLAVKFESINVLTAPGAMADLARLGARGVPIVARGDAFVYAQSIADVLEFVGAAPVDEPALSPQAFGDRLVEIVEAARRQLRRTPAIMLDQQMTHRPRSVRQLVHHIFRIPEVLLINAETRRLEMVMVVVEPPPDMPLEALLAYGDDVQARLSSWWQHARNGPFDAIVHTFYGDKPFAEVLERTTWHCAQHVRQLESLLEHAGTVLDQPLTAAQLRGLPMPADIWDE